MQQSWPTAGPCSSYLVYTLYYIHNYYNHNRQILHILTITVTYPSMTGVSSLSLHLHLFNDHELIELQRKSTYFLLKC